jgi:hypothetical protein
MRDVPLLTLAHPAKPITQPCSPFQTETDFVQVRIQVKQPAGTSCRPLQDSKSGYIQHTIIQLGRAAALVLSSGCQWFMYPNPIYQRALESHERHAQRWGGSMKVLRQDVVGGLWNKPAYLLSLVLQELEKPPAEQVKWLMFVLPQGLPTVSTCRPLL